MKNFQSKNNLIISKQYQNLINEINELENELKELSDTELRTKRFKLEKEYQKTKNLDELITRSFSITREASVRTLGLRHFDVQLMGGLVLNNNKIAEMKTGEGKTLVATLPASLNALTNKGVHIVTVNDYLANRDQVSMGQIYRFLGFDTGLIQSDMSQKERKYNYQTHITYVTNYELTFDYLRDNTTLSKQEIVLRPFNYCIIDEVDSILIDEAQTPIILADNSQETPVEKYVIASEITNYLKLKIHYEVDEKNKNITLTTLGSKEVEKILQTENLYDFEDPWIPYILNALRANSLYFNNIQYIIQNNRIIIVDEFTGRIMPDRRWGDGLHQAVEAKEKLPISPETVVQASITYQNFFLMYPKLSGMTGTAKTSEIEFEKIYNLVVDIIPTYRPIQRDDLSDILYKDQFSKWKAIIQFCNNISITGQPILIGTTSVEKSDMLGQLLKEYDLPYQILNAKPENVRRESEIIAQAGKKNSITIATNMAGRGTDIILGGNSNFYNQKELYNLIIITKTKLKTINQSINSNNRFLRHLLLQELTTIVHNSKNCSQKLLNVLITLLTNKKFLKLSDIDVLRILQENDRISTPTIEYQCSIRFLLNELKKTIQKYNKQKNQIVKNLGGLYVIGTERNDSRRVDDQLKGRCGRQGDPGTSQFYISLDDNLLRLFGGEKVQKFIRSQIFDDSPIQSSIITKSLNNAQRRIEERAYEQRKNLFEYDEILDQQRKIIYFEREKILNAQSSSPNSLSYAEQYISKLLKETATKEIAVNQLLKMFETLFGESILIKRLERDIKISNELDLFELKTYFFQKFWLAYKSQINQFSIYGNGIKIFHSYERQITLLNINLIWKEHLERILLLREIVGWRSYGQKNPLTEYKREAYLMYVNRKKNLLYLTIYNLLKVIII